MGSIQEIVVLIIFHIQPNHDFYIFKVILFCLSFSLLSINPMFLTIFKVTVETIKSFRFKDIALTSIFFYFYFFSNQPTQFKQVNWV